MSSMKRIVVAISFLVIGFSAFSQNPEPKMVLDKMSETYRAMPGFEISFVQKILSEGEVIDRLAGNASVSKEKFMIKFQDQHIYCDGNVLWTYLLASQELTISNFEPDEAVINPSNVYDIYKEGFTYEYKRSGTVNEQAVHVIELTSTDPDSDFTNVVLYIGEKDSYLKSWDLIDYSGAKTSFDVSEFIPNKTFDPSFFVFNEETNPVQYKEDLRYE